MMEMPSSIAFCGLSMVTGWPLIRMSPLSLGCAPARIFIRVDLPAPFSPSRAWTSPFRTVRETSSRARTPGYCLLMWRISRAGGAVSGVAVTYLTPRPPSLPARSSLGKGVTQGWSYLHRGQAVSQYLPARPVRPSHPAMSQPYSLPACDLTVQPAQLYEGLCQTFPDFPADLQR